MSSIISVNVATSPQLSAKGAGTDAGTETAEGAFAALLDFLLGRQPETVDTTATASTTLDASLGGLIDLNVVASAGNETDGEDEPAEGKGLLGDLIDALTAIETAVSSGQPVDPELKAKFEAALDAVAAALGIDLTVKTDPATTASTTTPVTGGAASMDVAADVTIRPETILARLAEKISALAAKLDASAPVETNGEVKVAAPSDLAAKLEALAQKLASTTIDAQVLAKLGLGADAPATEDGGDTPLMALLATKVEPKPLPAPVAVTQQLDVSALVDAEQADDTKPAAQAKPAAEIELKADTDAVKPEIKLAATATTETKAVTDVKQPAVQAVVAAAVATTKDVTTDPLQNGQTALPSIRTDLAVNARVVHAAYQAPQAQINLPQMAFEIARQVADGQSRFQIRLDPPELGRVDVKLDIDGNGGINARLTVERAETLDLLQRDQRSLEKALAQAGLDAGKTNLEFSLRQNPFTPDGGDGRADSPIFTASTAAEVEVETPVVNVYRGAASAGGVNIFV